MSEGDSYYRHGVISASAVALRVMRKMGVADDVWTAVADALNETAAKRPMFGESPYLTHIEGEIFRRQTEERFGSDENRAAAEATAP